MILFTNNPSLFLIKSNFCINKIVGSYIFMSNFYDMFNIRIIVFIDIRN